MSNEQNNAAHKKQLKENKSEENTVNDEILEYESFSEEIEQTESEKQQSNQADDPNKDQIRITSLEEEIIRTKDHMLRAIAEAENGRKRALREREDASKFAVSAFSKDLICVADNLRRAIEAVPEDFLNEHPQIKNLTDGIEATERELLRCFEKNKIQKIEPLNERFDPHFHEVMFEAPMPDKTAGTIIQVIEPGYTLHGRILRPARVGVVKDDGNQKPQSSSPGQTINTEV